MKVYEPWVDGVIEDYNLSGGGNSMSGVSSSGGIGRQYQYQQQQQTSSSSLSSSSSSALSSSYSNRDGVNNGNFGNGMLVGGIGITEKTYTSVTGIDFRLDRHHFLRRGQVLNIRCVASVVDQMWDSQVNISLNNFQPPQLSTSGQNPYSSGK